MSKAGNYFKTGLAIVNQFSGEKPHSSITDWIEVLSSDRYDDMSLDGIPELVESINIQGHQGTTEAARAIRKKLKYGNVHRQLRALVILRALTENANHGFRVNWANEQLLERLRAMATDSLLDPKVKKRLMLTFHAWSLAYADEPRMREVAGLFRQYQGGPAARKSAPAPPREGGGHQATSSVSSARGPFDDSDLFDHSWEPKAGQRGQDTYTDLAAARADADERKRERELKRKQDMEAIEARRKRDAEEEAQRRRKAKEERKNQARRPKFNLEKERPQIMTSVANAIQASNNLVNACRHVNRDFENVTENPRVQDQLDKAKAARRTVIRYIQLVQDESLVGTLIDANDKIVESIQLYDKLSKPATHDSDSDHETKPEDPRFAAENEQVERIRQRLEAQKIEEQPTGELQQMQDQQMIESQKQQARRERRGVNTPPRQGSAPYADLRDLEFGPSASSNLPPPMRPDSAGDRDNWDGGSLSDFSNYDSSDEEWRKAHSRRTSQRYEFSDNYSQSSGYGQSTFGQTSGSSRHPDETQYQTLEDDYGSRGLLDPNDPFGDPFGDDNMARTPTPSKEKKRMEWAAI